MLFLLVRETLPSSFQLQANFKERFVELTPRNFLDLAGGERKKISNTTECVPVPTSEHVAEIVGRQGSNLAEGVAERL